jgi:arylsulfatase A
LAASGMRFTDFYAPAPNCSPSRAGLLTGRSPSRTGMYSYIPPNGPHYLPSSEITIAELLRDAGYNTAHMGKWHLCYDMLSEALPQPIDHGFNYSLGTENNAIPSHRDPTNFVRNGKAVGKQEGYS